MSPSEKMIAAGRTVYRNGSWAAPQPAWMKALKVGDIIVKPWGPWRIVREVSRYHNGDLRSVTVVIRRCSWTRRCYTILNANDLRTFGYRRKPVKRRRLSTRMDKRIARAIRERGTEKSLTCCQVEGIA